MASSTTFSAPDTAGPHTTLILPSTLSDQEAGMVRDGERGTGDILITGEVFGGTIPIGVHTGWGSITARDFMSGTIVATAVGGIEDSEALRVPYAPRGAGRVRLK